MSDLRESEGAEAAVAALAPQFLVRLSAVLRTLRTHDVSNQAFQRQLKDFMAVLSSAMEEEGQDEVALVAVGDYMYLNGIRIKTQASMLPTYHAMMSELERRTLGGI